jgi:hypothetical protein
LYDFYFGSREDIEKDPQKWLLTIKRMLPRWPNGIPDSEYLALYDLLQAWEKDNPSSINRSTVLLETGSGASTIVLLYFALKWDMELYTWDISSNKLAYLRGLLTDTLMRHFSEKNIFNHWKYIPYSSNSSHVGISVLSELGKKVGASFFDSDHTWKNLESEVSAVCPLMASGGIIAIDDGNYQYKNYNTAYINMIRTKLGLDSLEIEDNECQPFWEEVENVLNSHFKKIQNLNGGSYRQTYKQDLFWSYYRSDRDNMGKLGMEKLGDLAHRFDAWKVNL